MVEAGRLAATGAPSGTVVLAEQQTAGRGRLGRAWHSEADSGLYLTLILRPARTVPLMTLATGLALRQAIADEAGAATAVDIRWPNDILIGSRKCAGILLTSDGETVLAGVGVNVNHTAFSEDLASIATSLRLASGREHSREGLLLAFLGQMETFWKLDDTEVLARFTAASSYVNGLRVQIDDTGLEGTTCGLDSEGFLLLQLDDGRVERIVAGGVRPLA